MRHAPMRIEKIHGSKWQEVSSINSLFPLEKLQLDIATLHFPKIGCVVHESILGPECKFPLGLALCFCRGLPFSNCTEHTNGMDNSTLMGESIPEIADDVCIHNSWL